VISTLAVRRGRDAGHAQWLRAYHDSENLWEQPIPGTEAALEELSARYRLGDVFKVDVLGARAAGMRAILIDRTGFTRTSPARASDR
jgi:hypothetical protein